MMINKERIFPNAMLSTNMPWNSLGLDLGVNYELIGGPYQKS
jgi:hypothetical protein